MIITRTCVNPGPRNMCRVVCTQGALFFRTGNDENEFINYGCVVSTYRVKYVKYNEAPLHW